MRPQRSLLRCAGRPSSNRALLCLGLVSLFSACGGKEAELADADERHMTLEIEPMLERIRRRDGPARS